MHIQLDNRQRRFRIDRRGLRSTVSALACRAVALADGPWREVTLILVDDAGMEPVNRRIMGHEGTTDVITQRYESLPGEPAGLIGELVVNVERAWQVGGARSASRELALYIAHGLDHLNEEDDSTPAGRLRMRRRELRWLSRVPIPRLLNPDSALVRSATF
jgi:rRNA maturation RNase YbeY